MMEKLQENDHFTMWSARTKYVVKMNDIVDTIYVSKMRANITGGNEAKAILNASFTGVNELLFDFFHKHLGAKESVPNGDEFLSYYKLDVMTRDLPQKYNWEEAQRACPQGWRLPISEELKKLVHNRLRIGKFNGSQYWPSDEKKEKGISRTMNDCKIEVEEKKKEYYVRVVRASE